MRLNRPDNATGRNLMFSRLRKRITYANVAMTLALVLALSVAVLLALSAGVAQAEPPKLVSYGSFASEGPGVAVDQSSGDVFTAGLLKWENGEAVAQGHINKFDAAGKPISPPSPFGGEAFYAAAAVNPTSGNLYVLSAFGAIETYDPNTGQLLSSFEVPASRNLFGFLTIVQIAADSAGNVYVPVTPENEVLEYSPSGTLLNTFTGSGASALKEPTGVAVDSSGNVWVADAGNNRIEELSAAGAHIGEIKSEGVQSVALGTGGDVFAVVLNSADSCGEVTPPCPHLMEYSATGAQLADVGAGYFGTVFGTNVSMVAVNDSSGSAYVTDDYKNTVWVFGPPSAPVVTNELVAEASTSEAKLGALVNPGGINTTYRFEYGTTSGYGHTTPFPEGEVGEGVTSRTVWASASGLQPGTTYHYRIVATNELGTAVGADQTFTTETAAEASCPNEQLRGGFSASLPDCRAYELVTPPNSASAEPDTEGAIGGNFPPGGGVSSNYAARTGERMSYRTAEVMPGADSSGFDYVATRGANGWSSEDVIPLASYDGDRCVQPGTVGNTIWAYSADLAEGVLRVGGGETYGHAYYGGGCGAEGLEVVRGEPLGVENLLLRDNTTGTYRLINVPPAGVTPTDSHFQGTSADASHVVFSENAQLTANAPAGVEDLYEWDEGALRLVTVLPDGTPVVGSLAANWGTTPHVISAEGARVFFNAGGNLYVRVNGERTERLDESRGGSGPGGGGSFQDASADGSQAFFTDGASAGLTSDTASGSGANLYRYADGQLTDLTPAEHAEVVGVSGISEDGSYVYFVADGVLSGSQANQRGETARAGSSNLYLWHGGTTTFIAGVKAISSEGVRVSPNGAFLAFASGANLTGYDNTDAINGYSDPEIFLYSAASDQLVCVSCNPSGEPPSAGTATSLGGASLTEEIGGSPRYLSNTGRVFFQTREALLPRDTNGQMDVYEYEQGQLHLISSGTGSTRSVLLDAGENGNDVFFLSRQSLVPQDSGTEALVIYDARVDGGFPAPVSPPPCTTADACRTPSSPQPAVYGAPSSQTFSGAGNLASPAKPAVKPRSLTRRQKLTRALRACHKKKSKRKRLACERQAKNRYGAKASRKANASKRGGK